MICTPTSIARQIHNCEIDEISMVKLRVKEERDNH